MLQTGNSGAAIHAEHEGPFGLGVIGVGKIGVSGITVESGGIGVRGLAGNDGWAGFFDGKVTVTGILSKGGGSLKIDHPLDPEHKYLLHSFVESPDMMNIYNGNVVTDGAGYAEVELPDWFETLNRDFRYQLTVIGTFAQAIIAEEIVDAAFLIQTSEPFVKVSWQVTGIRQDPFANANRIPVEEDKPASERGSYLHPEAYGPPASRNVPSLLSER